MKNNIPRNCIYNMDETSVFLDMAGSTTVHFKGAKKVLIRSNTQSKTRYTVVLTANADGRFLKIFFIFKGTKTKHIDIKYTKKYDAYTRKNAWMDINTVTHYINLLPTAKN